MNAIRLERLNFSILLLVGLHVNAQSIDSSSTLNEVTPFSMSSFNLKWKQPIHKHTNSYPFQWNELTPLLQTRVGFFSNPFTPTGSTFNSGLKGTRLFFIPISTQPKETGYSHSSFKLQSSESPNLYGASGLNYLNQQSQPSLTVWLPPIIERPMGKQVVEALLYTTLNAYSTWNQRMVIMK